MIRLYITPVNRYFSIKNKRRSKKVVNYLDVTFNLNDGTYRTYQKPDNIIQYIHVEPNHPPNIIKQISKTIEKCLSQLSSNEEIFNESAPFYEDKLHQSGYQQKLKSTLLTQKLTANVTTKEI